LREFVEKYFSQALSAFLKSQREFERYMGQALGLYSMPPVGRAWMEMMMGQLARSFAPPGAQTSPSQPVAAQDPPPAVADLQRTVEELRREVTALREGLHES
jgi:hypothetical protein